jgi:hypothetical protein
VFGPNAKFLRKRVALFYRPVDPGTGAKTVDRLVKTGGLEDEHPQGPANVL